MRWLKHLTNARRDEKLAELYSLHGYEGKGFYWDLVETIAEQMFGSEKCDLTMRLAQWARSMQCHQNMVLKYFRSLESLGLVEVEWKASAPGVTGRVNGECQPCEPGVHIRVIIRKLMDLRDEYSKKSGQTPDKLRSKRQSTDTDTDTEKELEVHPAEKHMGKSEDSATCVAGEFGFTPPPGKPITREQRITIWFDKNFWPEYPLKKARKKALDVCLGKHLLGVEPREVMNGLRAQLPGFMVLKETDPSKIPHAGTWLAGKRWKDEVLPFSIGPKLVSRAESRIDRQVDAMIAGR